MIPGCIPTMLNIPGMHWKTMSPFHVTTVHTHSLTNATTLSCNWLPIDIFYKTPILHQSSNLLSWLHNAPCHRWVAVTHYQLDTDVLLSGRTNHSPWLALPLHGPPRFCWPLAIQWTIEWSYPSTRDSLYWHTAQSCRYSQADAAGTAVAIIIARVSQSPVAKGGVAIYQMTSIQPTLQCTRDFSLLSVQWLMMSGRFNEPTT